MQFVFKDFIALFAYSFISRLTLKLTGQKPTTEARVCLPRAGTQSPAQPEMQTQTSPLGDKHGWLAVRPPDSSLQNGEVLSPTQRPALSRARLSAAAWHKAPRAATERGRSWADEPPQPRDPKLSAYVRVEGCRPKSDSVSAEIGETQVSEFSI